MTTSSIAARRAPSHVVTDVMESVFGSIATLEANRRELHHRLQARGIYFGDGLLPTYVYAMVWGADQKGRWASRAERLVEAAERASRHLVSDVSFCETLGVDREALELLRVDPGYQRNCVLCRPDGIPIGDDVKFVELNSDSPAMMMFLDVVAECMLELDAFAPLRGVVEAPRSTDGLLETLVACHREFGGGDSPAIAIADWEGQKTRFEHLRLAEYFEQRGYPTVVCDPRAFQLVDGELRLGARRIDLVYRRALASEVLARRDELGPLLTAYRDGTVCMVNPLRSYLAGAKAVMSRFAPDLVPTTHVLDNDQARELVSAAPDRWVLKRSLGHGGGSVVLPDLANQAAWRAALAASRAEPWIAQEYLEVPQIAIPVADGGAVVRAKKYFNWNPFVFGGRFAGGLVRVSSTPLINITLGGGVLATYTA